MRGVIAFIFALLAGPALADSFSPPSGSGATVTITSGAPSSSTYTLTGTVSYAGSYLAGVPVSIFKNGNFIGSATTSATGGFSYSATGLYNGDIFTATAPTYALGSAATASISVPSQDVLAYQVDYTQGSLASGDADTRSGTIAAYYNSSGYLQTPGAGTNTARFDYNPSTLMPLGLILEGSDTNNASYSNIFSNAYWTKTNVTLTSGAATSPDNASNGWSAIPTTTSAAHNVYYTTAQTIPTSGTVSVYAKPDGYNDVSITCNAGSSNWAIATFNVSTGLLVKSAYSGTFTFSGTPQIQYVGNGWYRLFMSWSATASGSGNCNAAVSNTDNPTYGTYADYTYAGNGTSGAYIFGFQQSSNAVSSYIPTTSATATRGADALTNSSYAWSSYSVIAEIMDEVSGIISRNYYAAGTFTAPTNKWYRRICVYPSGADTAYLANQLNIGAACY